MGRVATDEHAPVTKAVCHQAAANPVLFRDDLVAEVRFNAEDGADGPTAIN
jgi:hypothetical protein